MPVWTSNRIRSEMGVLELELELELVLGVNCGRHWRWKRENGHRRNRDSLGYERNYDSHTDSEEDGSGLIGRWR